MSIAAISSSFVAAVRERVSLPPVDAVDAPPPAAPMQREGGRRHDLVDAMKQVLGIDGEQDRSDDQAVFRFAHTLMHDLRKIDGGDEHEGHGHGHGRGHAWGRRSWSDLPERLQALATAAAAPAPAAPAVPTAPPEPPVQALPPADPRPTAPAESVVAPPELPPQPTPITTTSAAVHLMQVPSSRLLEAFAALRRALGDSAEASTPATTRADLAVFLERLSTQLSATSPAGAPTSSLLNLTA
jgi:hypothetical protein